MHAPGDGARRAAENDAGLVVREALQRHEHHCRAQGRRERIECADEARVALAQLGRASRIAVGVDRDGLLHARIVEAHGATPRAVPSTVQRAVDRDPIEPREELAAAFEGAELMERAEKRLLRDVVGLGARAREVQAERVDARTEALDEQAEGRAIATARAIHEGVDLLERLALGQRAPTCSAGRTIAARIPPRGHLSETPGRAARLGPRRLIVCTSNAPSATSIS